MRVAAALGLAVGVLVAGCGSGSKADSEATPPAGSLESFWRTPGEDVAIVPGAVDFATGRVRLPFLIVDGRGRVVSRPRARIWLARGLKQKPFYETTARFEHIAAEGGHAAGAHGSHASGIFVTHLNLPRPGTYWLLAEPEGGRKIQAVGMLVVNERSHAPAVGEKAPPSRTPTIASTGGDLAQLTTQEPPDRALLRHSIAASLASRVPFVVTFATPRYCTSRACGPIVDVLGALRRRYARRPLRFIHVEIYKDNDPSLGFNKWVREWRLPTEPFTFLVGADGNIKERFEGPASARELTAAIEQHLLAAPG